MDCVTFFHQPWLASSTLRLYLLSRTLTLRVKLSRLNFLFSLKMQTLQVELVQQILLLMPYRDCLQLAKTSNRFYSIFTSCYYHSAKIEDIDHWMKLLMTGYIPQALRVPSYKDIDGRVEVTDGILIRLNLSAKRMTSVPDFHQLTSLANSIGNLLSLTELY
jgi:hypothetical protein